MASGHVSRINRPNTWLHRPSLQREESPCQLGAVHTWHIPTNRYVCFRSVECDRDTLLMMVSAWLELAEDGGCQRS